MRQKRVSVARTGVLACFFIPACLFLLMSCRSHEGGNLLFFQSGEGEDVHIPMTSEYRIVISRDCGAEVISQVDEMAEMLRKITGIPTETVFDDEPVQNGDKRYEILIGYTERSASRRMMKDLKRDDYLCQAEEGCLVLGGKSDCATLAALEKFERQVLPYADDELLLGKDGMFVCYADYEIPFVKINGLELSHYRISYFANQEEGKKIALALRERIADVTGYYPEIVEESQSIEGKYRIVIGDSVMDDTGGTYVEKSAVIFAGEREIYLTGSDSYGICFAAEQFCNSIAGNAENGACNLAITGVWKMPYEVSGYRFAAVPPFVRNAQDDAVTVTQKLAAHILACDADVVSVFALSEEECGYLENQLSGYRILKIAKNGPDISALLYRNSRLHPISCETLLSFDTAEVVRIKWEPSDGSPAFDFLHIWEGSSIYRAQIMESIEKIRIASELSCMVLFSCPDTSAGYTDLLLEQSELLKKDGIRYGYGLLRCKSDFFLTEEVSGANSDDSSRSVLTVLLAMHHSFLRRK